MFVLYYLNLIYKNVRIKTIKKKKTKFLTFKNNLFEEKKH